MAQFSIEINDADINRVLDAVCANYGRPDKINNPNYDPNTNHEPLIDNPETKPQFANRKVREFLAENVAAYEIRLARERAIAEIDATVTITDPEAP